MKVRGKVTASYDGSVWDYSVSVSVRELDDRKKADQLLAQMIEATGQQVLEVEES